MKQTKKERLGLLKTSLNIGTNEFAAKAKISPVTVWNIENGAGTSPKTDKAIVKAFNLNRDWWDNGKGEMLSDKLIQDEDSINPWKEEAYKSLKDEVAYLREMLKMAMGNPNFQEATDFLRAA